jgi:hypothetical protein
MVAVSTIRTNVQTALATITGLRAHNVWPDQLIAPAALVRVVRVAYAQTEDAMRDVFLEIVLLAAPSGQGIERGQKALDAYLDQSGTKSIVAAVENGQTRVVEMTDYGELEVNGVPYLGCRFSIQVLD